MSVVTRFAPSPTGYLHIGGARTALFNWLFAKSNGGNMLLRIEDTDRQRSTEDSVNVITEGLRWLKLDWNGDAVSQFSRHKRHQEIANHLLQSGGAYRCFCTKEELSEIRRINRSRGQTRSYDGRCRNQKSGTQSDRPYVIRLMTPQSGETIIKDAVRGTVKVKNSDIDDMILLRADGSPTYMLSVVVDDHDMGVTHIIRGDDHLTNAIRQRNIYDLLEWQMPACSHIPLIHGSDGSKLSKRYGALAIHTYKELGYLPEAILNYLMRLGWSHGDDEFISTSQAIKWFNIESVGKSSAKHDLDKLNSINRYHMSQLTPRQILELTEPIFEKNLSRALTGVEIDRLCKSFPELIERSKTLLQLVDSARYCVENRPIQLDENAAALLTRDNRRFLGKLARVLSNCVSWNQESIEIAVRTFADSKDISFGTLAKSLRAALTGTTKSPGIFNVLESLGIKESVGRLEDVANVNQD